MTLPQDAVQAALDAALRLLTRRAHAEAELRRKLRSRHIDAPVVDHVVAELTRTGLLDDAAFARQYCSERLVDGRPAGQRRVLAELSRRGVPHAVAEEQWSHCLEEAGGEEQLVRRALEAGRRKWRARNLQRKEPRLRRQALLRHLAAKGFDQALCCRVLDQLCREDDEPDAR